MSADTLASAITAAGEGLVLVVTGAGISLASGIPTFRGTDPGAIWHNDVTERGTLRHFQADPVDSWAWYLARFDGVRGAAPNPGHHALAALERWQVGRGGQFLLVTQNVDTLHEQAGAQALVKVHGSADRVRCSRLTCELGAPRGSIARADVEEAIATFLADPADATVPRCPRCKSRLRQHVLWFDEMYTGHLDYQYDRVRRAGRDAALMIFVGTSFSVGITDMLVEHGLHRRIPVYSIDPGGSPPPPGVRPVAAKAEELLPAVVSALAR